MAIQYSYKILSMDQKNGTFSVKYSSPGKDDITSTLMMPGDPAASIDQLVSGMIPRKNWVTEDAPVVLEFADISHLKNVMSIQDAKDRADAAKQKVIAQVQKESEQKEIVYKVGKSTVRINNV